MAGRGIFGNAAGWILVENKVHGWMWTFW